MRFIYTKVSSVYFQQAICMHNENKLKVPVRGSLLVGYCLVWAGTGSPSYLLQCRPRISVHLCVCPCTGIRFTTGPPLGCSVIILGCQELLKMTCELWTGFRPACNRSRLSHSRDCLQMVAFCERWPPYFLAFPKPTARGGCGFKSKYRIGNNPCPDDTVATCWQIWRTAMTI